MALIRIEFELYSQAEAFAQGVEYVSDSNVWIKDIEKGPHGGGVVLVEDRDIDKFGKPVTLGEVISKRAARANPEGRVTAMGRAAGGWVLGLMGSILVGGPVVGALGYQIFSGLGSYLTVRGWKPVKLHSPAQAQRVRDAAAWAGVGGVIGGPLVAAIATFFAAGPEPTSKKNPMAYAEYRHITDGERERLIEMITEAQAANVKASMAEMRREKQAKRLRKEADAALERLTQMEERLVVQRQRNPEPRGARHSQLKKALLK